TGQRPQRRHRRTQASQPAQQLCGDSGAAVGDPGALQPLISHRSSLVARRYDGTVISFEDLPIRDDLRGMNPYGAPQLPVPVTLNVNENTFGIPEAVAHDIVARLAEAVLGLNRYPDREFVQLRTALAG